MVIRRMLAGHWLGPLISGGLSLPLGVVTAVYLARCLGPAGRGHLDGILAAVLLAGLVGSTPFGLGISRRIGTSTIGVGQLVLAHLIAAMLAGIAAAAIALVEPLPGWALAAASAAGATTVIRAALAGLGATLRVSVLDIILRMLLLGMVLAGGWEGVSGIVMWVGMLALLNLVASWGLLMPLLRPGRPCRWRDLVAEGWLGGLAGIMQIWSMRIVILLVWWFLGSEPAGILGLALLIGQVVLVPPQSLGAVIFARETQGDPVSKVELAAVLRVVMVVSLALGLAGWLAALILPGLVGGGFASLPVIWAILIPGIIAQGLQIILANRLLAQGQGGQACAAQLAGMIVSVACLVWPGMDIIGASIGTSMGMIVTAAGIWRLTAPRPVVGWRWWPGRGEVARVMALRSFLGKGSGECPS